MDRRIASQADAAVGPRDSCKCASGMPAMHRTLSPLPVLEALGLFELVFCFRCDSLSAFTGWARFSQGQKKSLAQQSRAASSLCYCTSEPCSKPSELPAAQGCGSRNLCSLPGQLHRPRARRIRALLKSLLLGCRAAQAEPVSMAELMQAGALASAAQHRIRQLPGPCWDALRGAQGHALHKGAF